MDLLVEGAPVSQGIISGKVRVITSMKDLDNFQKGEILVASQTNPSYTIVMMKSSGIITDIGGLCSHAAIVARELGVPCIVATGNATIVLKNGQEVTMDGTTGKVYSKD